MTDESGLDLTRYTDASERIQEEYERTLEYIAQNDGMTPYYKEQAVLDQRAHRDKQIEAVKAEAVKAMWEEGEAIDRERERLRAEQARELLDTPSVTDAQRQAIRQRAATMTPEELGRWWEEEQDARIRSVLKADAPEILRNMPRPQGEKVLDRRESLAQHIEERPADPREEALDARDARLRNAVQIKDARFDPEAWQSYLVQRYRIR
jgi:hypothetical protein